MIIDEKVIVRSEKGGGIEGRCSAGPLCTEENLSERGDEAAVVVGLVVGFEDDEPWRFVPCLEPVEDADKKRRLLMVGDFVFLGREEQLPDRKAISRALQTR